MDPGEKDLAIPISNGKHSKRKRNHFLGGKSTTESKKKPENGDSSSLRKWSVLPKWARPCPASTEDKGEGGGGLEAEESGRKNRGVQEREFGSASEAARRPRCARCASASARRAPGATPKLQLLFLIPHVPGQCVKAEASPAAGNGR